MRSLGRYKISGKSHYLKLKHGCIKMDGKIISCRISQIVSCNFPFLFTLNFSSFSFLSFVAFNQVRIPRENLLGNKTADVTPAGEYVTPFKDPNKRFGAALGALSAARVGITSIAVTNLRACVPIAIR